MKMLKKIIGVLLILVGGTVTVMGSGIVIVGCSNMMKWGVSRFDIIVEAFMIAVTFAGIGAAYGGTRIFHGERRVKKEKTALEEEIISNKDRQENKISEEEEIVESQDDTRKNPNEKIFDHKEEDYQKNRIWHSENQSSGERYTLVVEDVFPIHEEGYVFTGMLKGGNLALKDKLWVLKSDGTALEAAAERMEAFTQERLSRVMSAEGNTRIGIMVRKAEGQKLSPGDVVTNIRPNITDVDSPVENPRLKGLLAGRYDTSLDNIGELIRMEIAERVRFLVLVILDSMPADNGDGTAEFKQKSTMSFPYLTSQEDRNFQPVFTDWQELKRWDPENETGFHTIIMDADDISAMVGNNDVLCGIVVNPFTDNLILEQEQIAEWKKAK